MKKHNFLLLFLFFLSFFANAQYFEGFENGVPGTMTQTYLKGNTTWINYGLSALNVKGPLAEKNSAVFFNAMETKTVSTALQTPVLDLSDPKMVLEFKYAQRQKTEDYANILAVELSNDGGQTWQELAVYKETTKAMKTIRISLAPYAPSLRSCVRFTSTQLDNKKGFPIVLDDISLTVAAKNTSSIDATDAIQIYPNPSSGLFTLSSIEPVAIAVFDTNGRIIYSATTTATDTVIDLALFPQGVYFAKITGANCLEVKKLLIK